MLNSPAGFLLRHSHRRAGVMLAQVFLRLVPPVSTRRTAERYGAFDLIIL